MSSEKITDAEYSATDFELNVRNGYMIRKKDRVLGVLLVFGCGAVGALYLGWKPAKELFLWSFGFTLCLTVGFLLPVLHVGTAYFGFMMICHWISLMVDSKYYYEYTMEGRAALGAYNKKTDKEFKEDVEAVKAKASVFLKDMSEKLAPPVQLNQHKVNEAQATNSKVFCHECGGKLTPASKFCGSCGCKVENAA